jgi:hypothetical protein
MIQSGLEEAKQTGRLGQLPQAAFGCLRRYFKLIKAIGSEGTRVTAAQRCITDQYDARRLMRLFRQQGLQCRDLMADQQP